ncbi:MAG: hypothetical protein ACTSW4_08175 [Candidatus Ranarchaeia archaeon]
MRINKMLILFFIAAISFSSLEEGVLLSGISNLNPENKSVSYSLDLSRFEFSSGKYWVFSLDKNRTVGQFTSEGDILSFTVDLCANGTRLLMISQEKKSPDFSIEIFPKIPERPIDIYQITLLFLISILIGSPVALIVVVLRRRLIKNRKDGV